MMKRAAQSRMFRGSPAERYPRSWECLRCECAYDSTVEVLDLGTPGLDLAVYLKVKEFVVIVDAVHSDS